MRTKNGKRIGPVPITLVAVFALAAFLSAGLLLAPNGAQPAAAQAKADCTVTLTGATAVDAPACTAMGDTAVVEFVGLLSVTDEVTLSLLIADKSGPISAYPNPTTYNVSDGFQSNGSAATPARYRYQTVELAEPAPDSSGIVQPAKVRVTVPGNVLIWEGTSTSVTSEIADAPNDERQVTASPTGTLAITFLGMPALGKDLDTDHNMKLDDVIMEQCIVDDGNTANDATQRLVGEAATGQCTAADDATGRASGDWAVAPVTDDVESRSKLVVRTGAAAGANTNAAKALIDGTEVTHEIGTTETDVTIYALIQDAKGQNLLETPVDFTATTNPSGIISDRELSDDPKTAPVGSTVADGEIDVQGLDTPSASVPVTAEIDDDDAVAAFTLTDLNEIEGAFSVTVNVMAGDLNLGTVIITRPGTPATLHAGIFSMGCLVDNNDPATADDVSDDHVVVEGNDDCEELGSSGRFGAGEMVVVKAHLEDSLGNVVGLSSQLDSELADENGDLIGDAAIYTIVTPVADKTMPRAWVYTVDDEATLGDHMITVSTTAKAKDSDGEDVDIDDVTLTVTVAGPPHMIELGGADNIALNGSQTFTVTATDMLGGVPHLTDMNNMVTISVQPTDALVVGTDTSNQVTLDEDTGMAEFTVYASLDADDGDAGRIIARSGELEHILPITFGEETQMPSDELMPPMGIDVSTLLNTISVVWTPNSAQNATLIKVVLFNEDSTAIVAIKSYNPAASDPGAHDFENVAPGTYEVVVAAYRAGEPHALSASETVMIR